MRKSAWRRKHDADKAKREKLTKLYTKELKAAETTVRKLADSVVLNGKYNAIAHARTAEYLNDAMRSIRMCLTGEDRYERR